MSDTTPVDLPAAALEELHRAAALYGLLRRHSIVAAEAALAAGHLLLELKQRLEHGLWMRGLELAGIAYDTAARLMRLARRGATAAQLAELGIRGALEMLAEPRPRAKVLPDEVRAPAPEPGPPAIPHMPESGEGEFGTGAKFDEGAAPLAEAWQKVRERLRSALAPGEFDSWIENCRVEARDAGAALLAPSRFAAERVRQAYGERIIELWREAIPDVELTFGGVRAAPELALPEALNAGGEGRGRTLIPNDFDRAKPGHRMMLCQTLHGLPSHLTRSVLATLAFFDGGRGAFASNGMLAMHHGVTKKAVKDALKQCRAAGYLRSVEQTNKPSRHLVFPDGPPVERQRRLMLTRSFDAAHEASPAEAAESAAVRPLGEPTGAPWGNPPVPLGEPTGAPREEPTGAPKLESKREEKQRLAAAR